MRQRERGFLTWNITNISVGCLLNRNAGAESREQHVRIQEIKDESYSKAPRFGTAFYMGVGLQSAALLLQFLHTLTDVFGEMRGRGMTAKEQFAYIFTDPQTSNFVASLVSMALLDQIYGKLFTGPDIGVFNVESTKVDECGVPVTSTYGVVAESAEAGILQGAADTCQHFPTHVTSCNEETLGLTKQALIGDKCPKDDPLVVQQALFQGGSAFFIQWAFVIGCMIRFFDAVTDLMLDTWRPDFSTWNHGFRKLARKVAFLRGYKRDSRPGLNGGIYEDLPEENCCAPVHKWILENLGWKTQVVSQMSSDWLYSVLTMLSLQIGVVKGCLTMNTTLSFTTLTLMAYGFSGITVVIFAMIGSIFGYHCLEGFCYLTCCEATEGDPASTSCATSIQTLFSICAVILTFIAGAGYVATLILVFTNSGLAAKGQVGVIFDMIAVGAHVLEGIRDAEERAVAEG